eukprot:gene3281-6495_t
MEVEYWTNIKDYPDYAVSTFGNVENMKTGRILKAGIDTNGYFTVVLYKNGKSKTHRVHQLVAQAFLDNFDDKQNVDHIDNDRQNNNISNLRFATYVENSRNAKLSSSNTSGIKGVSFDSNRNKWKAYINIDGIRIHLGYYKSIEDAKQARINKAHEVFGEFINDCEN